MVFFLPAQSHESLYSLKQKGFGDKIMSSSPDGPQAKQASSSNVLSHTSNCPKWNNLNELFHQRRTR
ncbi:hypothetical protein PAMP_019291 [Pampus punctatissimus]